MLVKLVFLVSNETRKKLVREYKNLRQKPLFSIHPFVVESPSIT
jgi:hypothetical protein